jgi:RNA polymerase sigma factor (TIGR02999 family)
MISECAIMPRTLTSQTSDQSGQITELLRRWREGDAESEKQLFEIVMPNLRRLAHYLMKSERKDYSLQATELVSEAYLRLIAAKDRDWQNRKHFFAIAARVMRRILIDLARRPKVEVVPIEPAHDLPSVWPPVGAVIFGELLDELARVYPDWCTVVEMKHFLGLTDDEAAKEMRVPLRTLQRMWLDARKWLFARMEPRNAQSFGR